MKRTIAGVIGLAVIVVAVLGGLAFATPGSAAVSVEFARSSGLAFRLRQLGKNDVVVAENSFAPGGYTGWHAHPGKVVLGVQRGTITLYTSNGSSCKKHSYSAGDVFVERPGFIYNGVNESTTTAAVLNVTYFNVPNGGSPRIDEPEPSGC